jgi:YfiH family protein
VLVVDRPISELPVGKGLSYDASVTDRADVILSVRTADCVPILLYSDAPRAIGAVHAGWRGTLAGTVTHAVNALESSYGADPRTLLAAMGPCIHPCCYEVGQDVYKQFVDRFGSEAVAIVGDTTCVDLLAVNRLWLIECGVSAENIDDLGLCTQCNPERFFSHRREAGQSGRHLSYITLRPEA